MGRTLVAAFGALVILAACQTTEPTGDAKLSGATVPKVSLSDRAVQPAAATGELGDWLVSHSPCAGQWRYSGRYGNRSGAYTLKFRLADDGLVADIRSHLSSGKIATGTRPVVLSGADEFEIAGTHRSDYTRKSNGILSGTQHQNSGTIVHIEVQCSNAS